MEVMQRDRWPFAMYDGYRSRIRSVLRDEGGQALVEHSLIVSSLSGLIAIFRGNPYVVIGIIAVLIIILLFWRPKVLVTLVFIAVLVAIAFFIIRWVEYGYI